MSSSENSEKAAVHWDVLIDNYQKKGLRIYYSDERDTRSLWDLFGLAGIKMAQILRLFDIIILSKPKTIVEIICEDDGVLSTNNVFERGKFTGHSIHNDIE